MSTAAEAKSLLRQGRLAEAEKLFEQLLERAPDDVEILNAVAIGSLRRADSGRSISLLQRALQLQPRDPVSHYHLGRARAAAGDLRGACESYGTAVRLLPDFYTARLYFAAALDELGPSESVPIQYLRALQDAQRQGHWLNPDTTPRSLQAQVTRGVLVVRAAGRAMCEHLLEPVRKEYGANSIRRIEAAARYYLLEAQPQYPDPRQRPTFFYVPELQPAPYPERSLFPWIETLEARTDAIRAELERLLPNPQGRERVFGSDALEQENLRGTDKPPTWNGYYLYRHGLRREDNCRACPDTAAALDDVPLCHVRDHAPEVLFSVFTAGTHLLPHRGVTNTRLVGHLPLIVPADCALRVGGEIHAWQEGRVVVFDDTYEHEAWNRSGEIRVVLIFDIWNPHLTEVERAAVSDLIAAMGDFRHAVEQG